MFIKFNILRDNYIARTLIVGFENENIEGDERNQTLNNTLSDGRCNPLRGPNRLQHKAMIGGVEYPQYVPIHFNRNIDYECLNNNSFSKRMPVILFWNKFYGDDKFYFKLGSVFNSSNCHLIFLNATKFKIFIVTQAKKHRLRRTTARLSTVRQQTTSQD
jgi:hypothetical protein